MVPLSTRAEGTQRLYLEHFDRFLDFLGTDPEGLHQMYLDEQKTADPRDRGQTAQKVLLFMAQVEREGEDPQITGIRNKTGDELRRGKDAW